MSQDKSTGAGSGRSGWLWVALLASLAINLVIVGAVAGRALHRHGYGHGHFHGHGHGHDRGGGLGAFVQSLPPERAGVVRDGLKGERERLRPLRQAARAARAEVSKALAAEPFDKEKLRVAAAGAVAAEGKVREAAMEVIGALAERLSPAERAALAKHVQQGRPGGGRGRHGYGDKQGGEKPDR